MLGATGQHVRFFTYLRLGADLMGKLGDFTRFVRCMRGMCKLTKGGCWEKKEATADECHRLNLAFILLRIWLGFERWGTNKKTCLASPWCLNVERLYGWNWLNWWLSILCRKIVKTQIINNLLLLNEGLIGSNQTPSAIKCSKKVLLFNILLSAMTSNPDIRSWPGWSHICLLSKHYIMFIVYTYTLFLGSEVYTQQFGLGVYFVELHVLPLRLHDQHQLSTLVASVLPHTEKTEIFVWEFCTWFAISIQYVVVLLGMVELPGLANNESPILNVLNISWGPNRETVWVELLQHTWTCVIRVGFSSTKSSVPWFYLIF